MATSNTQLNDTQKTLVNMFKKPLTKVQLNQLKIILDAFLKIIDDIEKPEVHNQNFVKKIKKVHLKLTCNSMLNAHSKAAQSNLV